MIKLNENQVGRLLMLMGVIQLLILMAFQRITGLLSKSTFGSVMGLTMCFMILGMMVLGSVMNGTAPDFILNRYKNLSKVK